MKDGRPIPTTRARHCNSNSRSKIRASSQRLGPRLKPIGASSVTGRNVSVPKIHIDTVPKKTPRSRLPTGRISERCKTSVDRHATRAAAVALPAGAPPQWANRGGWPWLRPSPPSAAPKCRFQSSPELDGSEPERGRDRGCIGASSAQSAGAAAMQRFAPAPCAQAGRVPRVGHIASYAEERFRVSSSARSATRSKNWGR